MKKWTLAIAVITLGTGSPAFAKTELKTEDQKTLYAMGLAMGNNLSMLKLTPAELQFVQAGLVDGATGAKALLSLPEYTSKIQPFAEERVKRGAGVEKEKSKPYLEAAAKEKGATRTTSGMVYVPLEQGTGATPKATDKLKATYVGTFTTGEVFDKSKDGEPVEFTLTEVIPCWKEGILMMKVGGKAKLVCPSSVAYGDTGRPGVPGGATLVFEISLVGAKQP